MKRFFAILLILTMVLPLCVFANAAEEKVEIKPFYFSGGQLDYKYDKVYNSVMFWTRNSEQFITDDGVRILAPDVGGETPVEIAENLKVFFDTRPEGTRAITFNGYRAVMMYGLEDHIFMERVSDLLRIGLMSSLPTIIPNIFLT